MADNDRAAVEAAVRSELRARIDAWVAPTFRVSYDQEPHPDEVALTDRLTDAVLPLEMALRAALTSTAELQRERDEQRADLERLGQVEQEPPSTRHFAHAYTAGWYAALDAYRKPGFAEREAGWSEYRKALLTPVAERDDRNAGAADLVTKGCVKQ